VIVNFELSREYYEWLKKAIEERRDDATKKSLKEANPADIASLLDEFDDDQSKYVLQLLDKETAAEAITHLEEDVRRDFLPHFQPQEIAEYINFIDSDDAADILNQLPVKFKEQVIAAIDNEEKAAYILELMKYDEDCAGGLMAKELIRANVNWTVAQTIEEIRRQKENVEKIYSVYVVDNQNRLLGTIPLKNILLSSDDTRIADIYDLTVANLPTEATVDQLGLLAEGGPILEFGIGTGRLAVPLAARGHEVAGIDGSPEMVEILRAKPGGDAGDDHSAVRVPGEDEAVEPRFLDLRADVVDVVAERDPRMQFRLPRTEPAQGAGERAVSRRLEIAHRLRIALVATPGAVDEDVVGHVRVSRCCEAVR